LLIWDCRDKNVSYEVTLGGILFHRGAIAKYVEQRTRMSEWGSSVLLSYFASNTDRERNFSLFFGQTRVRVALYLAEMSKGASAAIKKEYVLACLEAKGKATTVFEHRKLFIELLKTRQWSFPGIGRRKVNRILPKIYRQTHEEARDWNEGRTPPNDLEPLLVFMELCAKDVLWNPSTRKFDGVRKDELPESRQEKRNPHTNTHHGVGHATPGTAHDELHGPTSITQMNLVPKQRSISLDLGKYSEALLRNALFRGLVEKMPGWYPYETFDIDFADEIVDYEKTVIDYDDDVYDRDDTFGRLDVDHLVFNFENMDVEGWMSKPQEDVEMEDGSWLN